jgi:hypothetical protein
MREGDMSGADEDVRTALRVASSDMPPGIDLLRGLRGRQEPVRRARYRLRALVSAGVLAAVGAATALGLTLTASVASAPSALAAVLAAEAKISTESYQFSSKRLTTQTPTGASETLSAVDGLFDPARAVGEENPPGAPNERVLFIGPHLYMPATAQDLAHGKRWVETGMAPPSWGALLGERPVDPAVMLALFRTFATVRAAGPASGPGWTGTRYTFIAKPQGKKIQGLSSTETGTVDVDAQGLVRRIMTITRVRMVVSLIRPGKAAGTTVQKFTLTSEATFGNFGCAVTVTAPPASEVYVPKPPANAR